MEAAWPVSKGELRDLGVVAAPVRAVLDRVVRLAARTLDAADAAVFVLRGTELVLVARCCRDPREAPDRSADPLLERVLATGTAVSGKDEGGLRAAVPIAWHGQLRGAVAIAGGGRVRRFGGRDLEVLGELAALAASALEEGEERTRLEEMVDAGVAALVRAVDMRDNRTGHHSESVGALARRVGERLGMDPVELWLLELGARLHDVGKIGVPDAILNKPGPLDADEWEMMRRHAELGAEMIAKVPGLEPVAPLVRSHHERWDGRGYPDGLEEDDIPLASRVISACDAFHAMTAERPYRAALGVEEALAELTDGAGTQFDPAVVGALWRESARQSGTPTAARGRRS
jgi:putative nucleotidyltransferase with HDIG domain